MSNPIRTPDAILSELQPLIRDILDVPTLVLRPDLSAKEVEEWDSLNHIRIVSTVEDRYAVRFTAAEIDTLANVGAFAALIASKLQA